MKYIVIGRKGVGKKLFLKNLIKHGININKYYTTNPDADPEIYDIISDEKALNIKNKILTRESNGYIYFTTQDQLDACQIICTDIKGLKDVCNSNPKTLFRIINIQMADDDRLMAHMANIPPEQKITEEEDFTQSCLDENTEHEEFEKIMTNRESIYGLKNVIIVHALINDATDKSPIFDFHNEIKTTLQIHERMTKIVLDLINEKHLNFMTDENGDIFIEYMTSNSGNKNVFSPISLFVEYILTSNEGMATIFMCWLKCKNTKLI